MNTNTGRPRIDEITPALFRIVEEYAPEKTRVDWDTVAEVLRKEPKLYECSFDTYAVVMAHMQVLPKEAYNMFQSMWKIKYPRDGLNDDTASYDAAPYYGFRAYWALACKEEYWETPPNTSVPYGIQLAYDNVKEHWWSANPRHEVTFESYARRIWDNGR